MAKTPRRPSKKRVPRPGGASTRPTREEAFAEVLGRLRTLIEKHEASFVVKKKDQRGTALVAPAPYQGKELWFAGVGLGKAYVSYHLFPVYMRPELLRGISAKLRARMQGKSCFNFRTVDEDLFRELGRLTDRCAMWLRAEGLL